MREDPQPEVQHRPSLEIRSLYRSLLDESAMSRPTQFQGWLESFDVPYTVIERVVEGDTVNASVSGHRDPTR